MNLRIILAATICFGLGTGGGTAWSVKKSTTARAATALADSMAAANDTTLATAEHGASEQPAQPVDSAAHGGSTGESHGVPPVTRPTTGTDAGHAATTDTTHGAAATSSPARDPSHAAPAPATAEPQTAADNSASTKKFAGILTAMKPEEAARVLEGLDDAAVKDVLLAMPEKKAAAILAKFSGDRAASLARALLARGTHD
jgi:hypothetical protein